MTFRQLVARAGIALLLVGSAVASLAAPAERNSQAGSAVPPGSASPSGATPSISVTKHSVKVGGSTLNYTATAGFIVLAEEPGKRPPPSAGQVNSGGTTAAGKLPEGLLDGDALIAKAKMFFVAYTLDNAADHATRPVTFVFNGGPGSSSAWLHMGSIAPRRVVLTEDGEAPPPPYQLVDNESTWLDATDLVFIDPVSTGFSRTASDVDPKQFHGLNEDIASVAEFIRLYITRNGRWLSPKFLFGESYGTTRAAGLADYLQSRLGLNVNGIVLLSNALNIQPLLFTPQNTDTYVSFIPTYATTAWYHQRLSADLQSKSVTAVASEARDFAGGPYRAALSRGDGVSADEKRHLAAELSRLTGIPAPDFESSNLRVPEGLFARELLKEDGRVVGGTDSRFTGLRYAPGQPGADEYDPSDEAITGPFTATFNDYVRRELGFQSDVPYEMFANVQPWNFGDARYGFPNTADALRKAMTRNPYLKVWVLSGYYDLLTPFFATENVFAGLNLDPSRRANIRFTYYPTGHMAYIHAPSRIKMKGEFLAFLHDATHQSVVSTASRRPPASLSGPQR